MKILKFLLINEARMKNSAMDLVYKAVGEIPTISDNEKYLMNVVAKVLELDKNNLFKGDAIEAEKIVKTVLGPNVKEATVTQIKQMIDPETGKKVMVNMDKAKPISLLSAFGGGDLQILHDMGLKTMEKPSYWEDLDTSEGSYRPWTELDVRRAEKKLGKKFPRVKAEEIFGSNVKPKGPLKSYSKEPTWKHGIVEFDDGTSYFIDTTQASTYARMWAKVNK